MREPIRLRVLRQSSTPQKHEPQPQHLNQNDLVKWIIISDAPDYASIEARLRSSENYPVMARHPKYLERFSARDLRIGLKCLRAMNDCAREENERLEKEANALGCVGVVETECCDDTLETSHASNEVEFDSPMLLEMSNKRQITVLRFEPSFYRAKVLPFIQACLIAEGSSLISQSPRTPTALPFPGKIKLNLESPRHHNEAKNACHTAAKAGLPQEACDTAARRRLSLVRKRDAPPVKTSLEPSMQPEPEFKDSEFPPTPGAFYIDDVFEDAAAAMAAFATRSPPTPDAVPSTPRAPDFSSSPGVGVTTPDGDSTLDPMDIDSAVNNSNGNETETAEDTPNHTRVDTLMATTMDTAASSFPFPAPFNVTSTMTTTSRPTPATLPLMRALLNVAPPAAFSTPMQPLRRSTRSNQSKSSAHAVEGHMPVARMSVYQLQREILRLCAERERCVARNEVLREWLRGVSGAGAGTGAGTGDGDGAAAESMNLDK